MMCGTCQSSYDAYKALKENLISVSSEVENCQSSAAFIESDFSTVIINKKPIDDGVISEINGSLNTISTNLNILVNECSLEMGKIVSGCPGPSHYENNRNHVRPSSGQSASDTN